MPPIGRHWGVLAAALALVLYAAPALRDGGDAPASREAAVEDIIRGQDEYRGRTVTVRADVVATIEPGAFTVGERARELLVLAGDDALVGGEPRPGAKVTVTGRVVSADAQIVDGAGFDAQDERFGAFERRAAILATTVAARG